MSSEEYNQLNSRLDRIERLALIGAKNVLSLEETSELTGFSIGHLYRLTSQKQIPHFKKNRKLYFLKSDIEEWLTEQRVLTNSEIESKATTYMASHK